MRPADMGGGGAIPATEYDFETIERLANTRGSWWQEKARAGHTTLSKIELDQDSFSAIDSCQRFGTTYAAAHQIYLETLAGVQRDVEKYQKKLLEVSQRMRRADDNAVDVFAGFNQDDTHTSFASDAAYQDGSRSTAANEAEHAQTEAQTDQQEVEAAQALEEQRRAQVAAANAPQHGPSTHPVSALPAPTPERTVAQEDSGRAAVG